MSFIKRLFLFCFVQLIICYSGYAQLSGNVNVGSGQTYTSLTGTGGLFAAINSAGLSGNLTVSITSNLTENGNNSLNQWAGTHTVTIMPSAATVRNISGTNSTALLNFNGADRITIDGRFSGSGNYLTFTNTNTAGSTFRFINDATQNTLTYCTIEGTSTITTSGLIHFGTTTGTTGNDNNTISNCVIKDAAGGSPTNAIYSGGSSSSSAVYNSNISILNNNIYNFYRNGQNCSGVILGAGSTAWTISGNSFYQTVTRTNANSTGWNVIYINTNTANNLTISGNYIGGTAANCGGTAWTVAGNVSNYFIAIRFSNAGTATASTISGNFIQNINFSSNPSTSGSIYFAGILIENGYSSITNNTIGNTTSNGSITITFNGSTSNAIIRAIDQRRTGSINNNTIGSFNIGGTNTGTNRFEIISYTGTPASPVTISNNTIGSTTTANSIQTTTNLTMQMTAIYSTINTVAVTYNANTISHLTNISTGSNSRMRGIYQSTGTTGAITMTNNIVEELAAASSSTDRFPNNTALVGIFSGSSDANQTITGNTIRGLRLSGNADNHCQGFGFYNSSGKGTFAKNRIYDLTNTSTASAPKIWGINAFWGYLFFINNQVTITNGSSTLNRPLNLSYAPVTDNNGTTEAGNTEAYLSRADDQISSAFVSKTNDPEGDFTNASEVKGIHDEAEFGCYYYYNSVYVGGTAASGNQDSWAYDRPLTDWPTVVYFRNNLFVNARTGGTGTHYVMGNEITIPDSNWSETASNYNVLIGSNAATIGRWGTNDRSISQWRTSSGGDKLSWSATTPAFNPSNLFNNISSGDLGINSGNYEAWIVSGKGIAISGQSADFDGTARSITIAGGCTDIGADEFIAAPPNCPVVPVDNPPGPGVTSTYTLWSRNIAVVTWGTGGTEYPASLDLRYYSGVSDPNAVTGNYSNSYWNMEKTGILTGATYDIQLYFGDNETYTITSPNANTRLAKYDTFWYVFAGAGSGLNQTELNWSELWAKTRGPSTFSNYALTDGSNPLPVEMCSFTGAAVNRTASLRWITCSESNNKGFDVERRVYDEASSSYGNWVKAGFVPGNGTTNEQSIYEYKDAKLLTGKYQYRLKQVDYNGNYEYHSLNNPSEIVIGKPRQADLYQNYPNPSNPNSKVDFQIPFASKVSLKVYDMTGREVAVLVNTDLDAGYYTSEINGSNLASGVYFYRLTASSTDGQKFSKTMKMVLIK